MLDARYSAALDSLVFAPTSGAQLSYVSARSYAGTARSTRWTVSWKAAKKFFLKKLRFVNLKFFLIYDIIVKKDFFRGAAAVFHDGIFHEI